MNKYFPQTSNVKVVKRIVVIATIVASLAVLFTLTEATQNSKASMWSLPLPSQGTQLEERLHTIVFYDDFSTNPNENGLWAIHRYQNDRSNEASWDSQNGILYLTRTVRDRASAMFANYSLEARRWQAYFRYKAGGGSGSDGFVFMFYKNASAYGRPSPGCALGFRVDGSPVPGYGIEFDDYYNSWWYDPSPQHIAVIKDCNSNHLVYTNDGRVEDNIWHDVKVGFDNGAVEVFVDGDRVINYIIAQPDYTYTGVGFAAATGGEHNNHIIDDFMLVVGDGPESTPVRVISEDGNPAGDARVYRNGVLAGVTAPDGTLAIPDLKIGDQLAATLLITEFTTPKPNHSNWAYRVYITSVDIPTEGEPELHEVKANGVVQTLTVKKTNTLIGFNIVASVEWDATADYLEGLGRGFERASTFLYDATDGQMLFERVTIYDNAQHWANADYLIHASNQVYDKAGQGSILRLDDDQEDRKAHIFLGRYFSYYSIGGQLWVSTSNSGSWVERDGFSVMIHEFGHYGLYLWDGYEDSEGGAQQCTHNRENFFTPYYGFWDILLGRREKPGAACIMDRQSVTSEFCSDLPANPHNKNTEQGQSSCWDTIVGCYDDCQNSKCYENGCRNNSCQNPPRWRLQSPFSICEGEYVISRNQVVAGPNGIPVAGWTTFEIGQDFRQDPNLCRTAPAYISLPKEVFFKSPDVTLQKSSNRVLWQGKPNLLGWIVVLGASNGDRLTAQTSYDGVTYIGSTQVSCPSGRAVSATSATNLTVELVETPFTLSVATVPSSAVGQAEVRIQVSTSLGELPRAQLSQSGALTPTDVPMAFDSSTGAYIGTLTMDANLPWSGSIAVEVTDTEGRSLRIFRDLDISAVTASKDAIVYSSDGQVELDLPAGSLSADGQLSIASDDASGALPEDMVILSGPYNIQAAPGVTINNTVILTMRYLDTGGTLRDADLSTVQIYRWDNSTGKWMSINSNSLDDRNEVSAVIDTFGIYAAVAERQYILYFPIILQGR